MARHPKFVGETHERLGNDLSFRVSVFYNEGYMPNIPSGYPSFLSYEARFSRGLECISSRRSSNLMDIIKFYNEMLKKYNK